jgi:glucokinase
MILAGDIGGTNSRLAVFDAHCKKLDEDTIKNAGRTNLTDVVKEFLKKHTTHKIDRACFGVAGPVADGKVKLTNLNWQLDEHSLAQELSIPKVALINDLVAHAEGIELLRPTDVVTLHEGEPVPRGNRAVIAAGTGLGEAGLVFDPDINGYRAFASEGGHSDFARGPIRMSR